LGVLLVVLMRDGDAKSRPPQAVHDSAANTAATNDARAGNQVPLPARARRMPRGNPPASASTDPAAHALADEAGNADQSAGVSADPTLAGAGNGSDGAP